MQLSSLLVYDRRVMLPFHLDFAIVDSVVVALMSFVFGSLFSTKRLKNFTLLARVSVFMIVLAKHYAQTHPDFKNSLSSEIQTELAKLHHKNVAPTALKSGHETGAAG